MTNMAASLDSRFVLAPSLEMYFVTKDTGLPLVGGQVLFFEDIARTVPKPVYQLVSAAPGGPYTYVVLPNPVTLSAVGTFQDANGNDILPYYFPYDGTPATTTGTIDLYYIAVYDSNGVLQFTREAWPNIIDDNINAAEEVTNFVPNGQFLLHNNVVASSANSYVVNKISQASTQVAPGGWSFEKTGGSSAVDLVSFIRYPATEIPTQNPRYAIQMQRTSPSADSYHDLRLKFPSVNQFASDEQAYNLYFEAQAVGSPVTGCQIVIHKNYGSGGSPDTEFVVDTFNLTTSYSNFNTTIVFQENVSKTIGALDDDFMQIVIRLPANASQTVQFTNFCLTVNDEEFIEFPVQTNEEQIAASTAGWLPTPDYNGGNLYLPLILTPTGCGYDTSVIGTIVGKMTTAAVNNELLCDGSSYAVNDYSSLGIPFSRLFNRLFSNTTNGTLFGGGVNYVNCYESTGLTNQLIIATNKGTAVQTAPADGGVATGFTFGLASNPSPGGSLSYRAYTDSGSVVTSVALFNTGAALASGAGTSGMTVNDLVYFAVTNSTYIFQLTALSASALAAGAGIPGLYFIFSSHGTNYYAWFKVTTETDPAPGGKTGVQINLTSTMSAKDVALVIANVLSSEQNNSLTVTGVPPAGSYFTFQANSVTYSPWYQVAGVPASAPAITNPIQVTLTGAETSTQVAGKTQAAINSQFFAVPDLRGVFLRGNDPTGMWDIDVASRYSYYGETAGTSVGTFQASQLISHLHNIVGQTSNFTAGITAINELGSSGYNQNTALAGGTETRPTNVSVNWFIKY